MENKDVRRQRRFKARMYEMGFKQMQLWVKRKPAMTAKTSRESFLRKLDKLTSGWAEADLSQLYNLLITIAESKGEVARLKST